MRLHSLLLPVVAALVAALCPSHVSAISEPAPGQAPPAMLHDTGPASFAAARDQILSDLEARDVYLHIRESERREVLKALERMDRVLDGVTAIEQLTPEEKAAVLNDQERVNTLLTQAWEQGQLVCKRDRRVGTRFKATQCRPKHEWDLEREAAQMSIKRIQRLEPRGGGR